MADDLRAAAEQAVDAVVLGEYNAAALLDAFLSSPECLALAVRTACEPFWYIRLTDGEEAYAHTPRPDVAAFLESTGEGAGDG